jgi:hypothetical protein
MTIKIYKLGPEVISFGGENLGTKNIFLINEFCMVGIPLDPANSDYQKFIQDVAEQGIEIVEGPDIHEPSYIELRQQAYPSLQEQQDMQYWDQINGTTIWQDTITAIKEQYPKTITGGTTIGPVPDWVQEAADNWTFNKQLREYVAAVERLEHYILSEGRPEIREDIVIRTEEVFNEETREFETVEITENVITQTAIEPLEEFIEVIKVDAETMESVKETVRNPLIVRDEEERAEAQSVIDATPQPVIDAINS